MKDEDTLLSQIMQRMKGMVTRSINSTNTKCEVHGGDLQENNAPHLFVRVFAQEYREAAKKRFPHANPDVLRQCLGGGILKEDGPKKFYCVPNAERRKLSGCVRESQNNRVSHTLLKAVLATDESENQSQTQGHLVCFSNAEKMGSCQVALRPRPGRA